MNLPMNVNLSWLTTQPTTVEEYKQAVLERLKRYDYVVTEENRKEAEQDKKALNEAYNKLHADRMSAYKEFDAVKKEMIATENLIKAKVDEINAQIKELDQHFIDEKQLEIADYFSSLNFNLVSLDKIFDKKWLNKSCKNWKDQMNEKIKQIENDLELINNFGISKEEKEEVKGFYLECLNISQARDQFDAQKARREMIRRQQEENVVKQEKSLEAYQKPIERRSQNVEQIIDGPKKQRINVVFEATRDFYDEMNVLIRKYKPLVKIISREDVE